MVNVAVGMVKVMRRWIVVLVAITALGACSDDTSTAGTPRERLVRGLVTSASVDAPVAECVASELVERVGADDLDDALAAGDFGQLTPERQAEVIGAIRAATAECGVEWSDLFDQSPKG